MQNSQLKASQGKRETRLYEKYNGLLKKGMGGGEKPALNIKVAEPLFDQGTSTTPRN